jgi:glutaminyl-peptide cyclotransferase
LAWGGLAAVAAVAAVVLLAGRHAGKPAAAPAAPASPASAAASAIERLEVKVLAVHPHDPTCYTQGLVWRAGNPGTADKTGELYESCGQYGQSSLRRTDPATGAVRQKVAVPAQYFAEGLALVGERLLQLTWREGVAFVYDRKSFEKRGELQYQGEGWGLSYDGKRLVMSDGSDRLTLRDPVSFQATGELQVKREGVPVERLNELECVGDVIYANVWMTDEILRIDAASGRITGSIDASGLLTPEEREKADVLNGIAWNPETRRFWITGKDWPKSFEVEFVPAAGASRP